MSSLTRVDIGRAGLQGWRSRLADAVAPPVAKRSPLSEDDVRALTGALFILLTVTYVIGTLRDLRGRS
jgi:hypothetical protein